MDVYLLLLEITAAFLYPWYLVSVATRYCLEYCHWMLFILREEYWVEQQHCRTYKVIVVLITIHMDAIHYF